LTGVNDMQGRRVYPKDDGVLYLQEGDYGLDTRDNYWYGRPPGHHAGSFKQHEIVEHDDGTITVSPSILLTDYDDSGEKVIWHGYLERGVWREV
jgi:hypothetical protein